MRVIKELLLVVALGVGFGLLANWGSARGVDITRNYFPPLKPPATQPSPVKPTKPDDTATTTEPAPTQVDAPAQTDERTKVWEAVEALGIVPITHDQAVAAYNDVMYEVGLTIFVDARDDDHYQEGHIPKAYQLDRFRPEQFQATVEAALDPNVQTVIVYCGGGDCEDSKFAAQYLLEQGVNPANVQVYVGGMNAWKAANQPRETGDRNSGQIVEGGS